MKKEMTYQKAFDELSKIVSEIEGEKIPLDQLAEKITKATELITFCREKLRDTERHFQQTIDRLQ